LSVVKKGFVLRTTAYGESDLVFDFLDHEGALQAYFAKGARASKKRFSGGVLDPLQYIELHVDQPDSYRPVLLEAKIINAFDGLRSNYDKIMTGTQILNMARFYSQEGLEDPQIFNLVGNALKVLSEISKGEELILWHFLARLMVLQGDLNRSEVLQSLLQNSLGNLTLEQVDLSAIKREINKQFQVLFNKKISEVMK
jgi:DNA repair protein RecO (recombination protein O)